MNIEQSILDQYIGDHVNNAVEQLKAMYPDFEVQKLHNDLQVTEHYVSSRIRVRYDNQFRVIFVTHG